MALNIVVCIKQVPNIAAMKFDAATKTIVRTGVPNEVSAFDIRALLKAVDLVKEHGGEVVALTMGPPQAAMALQQCLALGANRAIHLSDRAFAGADTLATARTLAAAIQREKFDLVFCGRYSLDAETGQVGPEVAELLGIPQVTGAKSFKLNGASATVERETDDGIETLDVALPFLLTATEDLAPERFPTKKDREAAKTRTVTTLTAADLGVDPAKVGQAGSPTSVKDIVTIETKRTCAFIDGADKLMSALVEEGLFGKWKRPGPTPPVRRPGTRTIWIVADTHDGRLRRVSLELLGKGGELGARLEAIVIGPRSDAVRSTLEAYGADAVTFLVDRYDTLGATAALEKLVRERPPHSILFGSTSLGRDLAPRLAARLGLGMTSDCIDLTIDGDKLVQHKPAFGGSVVAPILSVTFPQLASVRPGVLLPAVPDAAKVRAEAAPVAGDLEAADVVVGVGMGIGGPENLPAIQDFAKLMKAPLCTTRDVCDRGWLPRHLQVGLTGKSIAPRLYFAIGIKGAFEHTVGIRRAGVVVAVNPDEQAWIWDAADYGVKADWKTFIPELGACLKSSQR